MAVAQGYGKTVTSGSVFAYDVADTSNSYRGEPTVNVATGTLTPYTPYNTMTRDGQNLTLTMVGGSALYLTFHNGVDYNGQTITLSGYMFKNGLPHTLPNNRANTYHTVAATKWYFDSNTGYFEIVENCNASSIWLFHTPSGASGGDIITIRNFQVEVKSHATPFVAGTRSATQGLLPLVGNSTLDLTNMSFNSNAQMTFDGTNDYVSATPFNPNFSAGLTMECVAKWTSSPGGSWQRMFDFGNGASVDNLLFCRYSSTDQLWFGIYNGAGTQYALSNSGAILFGQYALYTATADGTNFKIYVNGQLIYSTANSTIPVTTSRTNNYIGKSNWPDSYFNGDIPTAKIYNRALSAAEIRQNYLHYKTRFNLS